MTIDRIDSIASIFLCLSMMSGTVALLFFTSNLNYNLCKIPKAIKEIILRILIGKKWIIKVNNVWTVGRGWKDEEGCLISIINGIPYSLSSGEYMRIDFDWSEEELKHAVVINNITDLKMKHPQKSDHRMSAHWNDYDDYLYCNNENLNIDEDSGLDESDQMD